jgi:membrane carboxypeptidase/penicillin-binding protein PbpC
MLPPTLSGGDQISWEVNPLHLWVNPSSGRLVDASCHALQTRPKIIALWPFAVEPWIPAYQRRQQQMGDYDASCPHPPALQQGVLTIEGLHDHAQLRSVGAAKNLPRVLLQTRGAQGRVYWFINGQLRYRVEAEKILTHQFSQAGHYQIAVSDDWGKTASLEIDVLVPLN